MEPLIWTIVGVAFVFLLMLEATNAHLRRITRLLEIANEQRHEANPLRRDW